MKRSGLWIIRLSSVLMSAGLLMADDASQVLKTVANTYQNLRSYYFEGSTVSETKMGASLSKQETKFVAAFQSPNLFRVEYVYPTAGNWIRVSDGTKTWRERSISKDFSEAAAVPEDIYMMDDSPIAAFEKIDKNVANATMAGSEPVTVGVQPYDCDVIQGDLTDPGGAAGPTTTPTKFWIDKTRHLVLRQVSTSSSRSNKGVTNENIRTTTITRADVSQPVPPAVFQLAPEPGKPGKPGKK